MAETTGTQTTIDRASALGATGPDTTDTTTTVVLPAEGAPGATQTHVMTDDPLQREVEELRRQNARYREQINGWQTQSQRNLDEVRTLNDRIARLEQGTTTPAAATATTTPRAVRLDLKSRLDRWMQNDNTALDGLDEVEAQMIEHITARAAHAGQAMTAEDVARIVQQQLATVATRTQVIQQIQRAHKELENIKDPIFQDVYENYEAYEAELGLDQRFPPSTTDYGVRLNSPFAPGQGKHVDARRLDYILMYLKATKQHAAAHAAGVELGRQQEQDAQDVGTVHTTAAATATRRSPNTRAVEAYELLDPKLQREITNGLASHAFPEGYPTTKEGIAKRIFDRLSPEKQQELIARHQRGARGAA